MWFPPQVPVSSLFFTHQPPTTGTTVGVDQTSGRQHAHILAVRARYQCMNASSREWGYRDFTQEFQTASDSTTTCITYLWLSLLP